MYVAEFGLPDFASYDTTSLRTGHDERRAVSGGADEARPRRDAHWRTGDCVRADGDFARGDDERRGDSLDIRVNTVGRAMPN